MNIQKIKNRLSNELHRLLQNYDNYHNKKEKVVIESNRFYPKTEYSKDVWLEEIEFIFRKMPIIKNKIKTYLKETDYPKNGFTTLQVIVDGNIKNTEENKKYEITIRLISGNEK